MIKLDLASKIFSEATLKIMETFKVDADCVRMDSVHIKSNFKVLTRGGVFHTTIDKFLKELKDTNEPAFDSIDLELIGRYFKPRSGYDTFGQVKPEQRKILLALKAKDLYSLVLQFQNDSAISSMESFQLMVRVLDEQCEIVPADEKNPDPHVQLKEPKDIPGSSLQNPTDPSATYDHKKGTGQQVQIAETCSSGEAENDEKPLNLILYAKT
jgi:hypothetical protein